MSGTFHLYAGRAPLSLAGTRCSACATVTFPRQDDCPRCATRTMLPVELPRRGRLWTWTVQTFPPRPPFVEPPSGFEPFALGYVELGEVLVETVIDALPEALQTGMTMQLVPRVWPGPNGSTEEGYAFAPIPEGDE